MTPTPTRHALVTGASTGIGRATALHLHGLGFRVFAGVRREADGAALRAAASERLVPLRLDVTQAASIEAAAKEVERVAGSAGLAGLVNNAGVGVAAVLEFLDLDELRWQLEVNTLGAAAVTSALLPQLRRAGGRIVNISSNGGFLAAPFLGPYAASKFALEALSDSLRRELRPWGIQVAVIQPGSIQTPIWEKGANESKRVQAKLPEAGRALYGRFFERMDAYAAETARRGIPPERVAEAVAHALTARRPRTRYRVGTDAKLTYLLTRLLPDRWLDAALQRLLGVR